LDSLARSTRIRFADIGDIPSLIILAEQFIPREACDKKRLEVLKRALKNPDYELLVAELEEGIVGFIDQWIIHDFTHGARLSYIHSLYVDSRYRRKGIASKLIQRVMKNAINRGVSEIHVTTRFDNESAINLYRKHGLIKRHLQLEKEFK